MMMDDGGCWMMGTTGGGVFTFALYSMVESNISTMFGCV